MLQSRSVLPGARAVATPRALAAVPFAAAVAQPRSCNAPPTPGFSSWPQCGCSSSRQELVVRRMHRSVAVSAQAGGTAGGGGGSIGGSGGGAGGSGGSSSSSGDGSSSTPHPLRNWTWAYAAFLAVGGTFAFFKAGSQKSLTSAMGAALILALSGRKMLVGAARGPIAVCLAISVFLSVIMAGRYSRSRKVMPAGMTAAASIGMSAAYILSLIA